MLGFQEKNSKLGWILGKNLSQKDKSGEVLEEAAQRSGVTVPGGIQEAWRYGTEGHGLVTMVVIG